MVNVKGYSEGKILKAEHIKESDNKVAVVTGEGEFKEIKFGKALVVDVQFNKMPKELMLNQRSAKAIMGVYGEDTADWVGKKIELGVVLTQNGKEAIVAKPEGDDTEEKEVDDEQVED